MSTEFICSIKKTGGDYPSMTTWEAANQCLLNNAATKVFGHGGITGAIPDGSPVTGKMSGATAVITHATSTQALLITILGTFQSGEAVYETDGVNEVTISDAGDEAISVAEGHKDGWETTPLDDTVSVFGWTCDATAYVIIRVATGDQHTGQLVSGGTYTGFTIKNSGFSKTGISNSEQHTIVDGIAIEMIGAGSRHGLYSSTDWICRNCIIDCGDDAGSSGIASLVGVGKTGRIFNNIVYNCDTGYHIGHSGKNYVYNCQAISCAVVGFDVDESSVACVSVLKNCLADGCGTDFLYSDDKGGSFTCDYCASSDDTADDQGGTGNLINQTFVYEDSANDYFKQTSSSPGVDTGTDLSADPNNPVTTDIVGVTYVTPFDMGAWNVESPPAPAVTEDEDLEQIAPVALLLIM